MSTSVYPAASMATLTPHPLPGSNAQIYFSTRHETHFAFTNVSGHPLKYQHDLYLTAEHLFQALKFLGTQPEIAKAVRDSTEPQKVANKYTEHQRTDWAQSHLFILEQVLTIKFTQYPGLRLELMATGEAQLIQLGSDQYWCRQENGGGRNEFGQALMRVRANLRRLGPPQ